MNKLVKKVCLHQSLSPNQITRSTKVNKGATCLATFLQNELNIITILGILLIYHS